MKPETYIKLRKWTIYAIWATLFSLLILPFNIVWHPEFHNPHWKFIFIYNDELYYIFVPPFAVTFALMLKSNNKYLKLILKSLLLFLALTYCGYVYLLLSMPLQDFAVGPGLLFLAALLPEIAYLLYMDSWISYNEKNIQ